MSEYYFGILYIKGKESIVVDALIKKPTIFSHILLKVYLRERVVAKLVGDTWYRKLSLTLKNGRKVEPKFGGYELEVDGLLQYQRKMYIPEEGVYRETILKESHILVYYSLTSKKDVFRYERTLLLDRNEERHCQIHC